MNIQTQLVKFLFIILPGLRRIVGNKNKLFTLFVIRTEKIVSKKLAGSHLVRVGCWALGPHHLLTDHPATEHHRSQRAKYHSRWVSFRNLRVKKGADSFWHSRKVTNHVHGWWNPLWLPKLSQTLWSGRSS